MDGLVTNPEATVHVLSHTGMVDLNGYSLAGYWTHYGPAGWYVNTVMQGTFYQGSATTVLATCAARAVVLTSRPADGSASEPGWLFCAILWHIGRRAPDAIRLQAREGKCPQNVR